MRELTNIESTEVSGGAVWLIPLALLAYTAGRVVHDMEDTTHSHPDDSNTSEGGGW